MKCPRCGRDAPEHDGTEAEANAPEGDRCAGCGQLLTSPLPKPGDWRPVTSLVDKPVDPSMIDETPPPRAKDIPELAQGDPEDGQDERRSLGSEELEASAPISPEDVEPGESGESSPERPPASAASRAEIPDFGEARQIPEKSAQAPLASGNEASHETAPPPPDHGDRWDAVRENVCREAPHLAAKGGFLIRVAAVSVDTIFLTVLSWAVFGVFLAATGLQDLLLANLDALEADPEGTLEMLRPALEPYAGVFGIVYAALTLLSFLYRPLCHATWGRTLGKWIFGLRVVTTSGGTLGLGKSFLRYLGYIISLIPIGLGVLWVVFDPQKQGWHDKMASTYVIKERGRR